MVRVMRVRSASQSLDGAGVDAKREKEQEKGQNRGQNDGIANLESKDAEMAEVKTETVVDDASPVFLPVSVVGGGVFNGLSPMMQVGVVKREGADAGIVVRGTAAGLGTTGNPPGTSACVAVTGGY